MQHHQLADYYQILKNPKNHQKILNPAQNLMISKSLLFLLNLLTFLNPISLNKLFKKIINL